MLRETEARGGEDGGDAGDTAAAGRASGGGGSGGAWATHGCGGAGGAKVASQPYNRSELFFVKPWFANNLYHLVSSTSRVQSQKTLIASKSFRICCHFLCRFFCAFCVSHSFNFMDSSSTLTRDMLLLACLWLQVNDAAMVLAHRDSTPPAPSAGELFIIEKNSMAQKFSQRTAAHSCFDGNRRASAEPANVV